VWDVWLREYLPALTTRSKWQARVRNLAINDLVLIIDRDMPRDHWRMGRVIEVFKGKNNCVRAANILTIHKKQKDHQGLFRGLKGDLQLRAKDTVVIQRPVTGLVLLRPSDQEPALPLPLRRDAVVEEDA